MSDRDSRDEKAVALKEEGSRRLRTIRSVLLVLRIAYRAEPAATIGLTIVAVASSAATVVPPLLLGKVVETAEHHGPLQWPLVLYAGAWFAIRVLSTVAAWIYGRVEQTGQRLLVIEKLEASSALESAARTDLNDTEVAYAIDRASTGFRQILSMILNILVPVPVMLLAALAALVPTAGLVPAVIFGCTAIAFLLLTRPLVIRHEQTHRDSMAPASSAFAMLENAVRLWRDAKLSNATTFLASRYADRRREFETAISRSYRAMVQLGTAQAAILYTGLALMMLSVATTRGSASAMVVAATLSLGVIRPLEALGFGISSIASSKSELTYVDEILTPQPVSSAAAQIRTTRSSEPTALIERIAVDRHAERDVPTIERLQLSTGRPLWVIGPSGAGKTTLLDALSGLGAVRSGAITIGAPEGYHSIAYLPQSGVILEDTIFNNVGFGAATEGECARVLVRVGLYASEQEALRASSRGTLGGGNRLSGGEERRLLLARALVRNPAAILCDEPTAGLDAPQRRRIWDILVQESDTRVVIIATHDPEAPILPDDQVIDISGSGMLIAS